MIDEEEEQFSTEEEFLEKYYQHDTNLIEYSTCEMCGGKTLDNSCVNCRTDW